MAAAYHIPEWVDTSVGLRKGYNVPYKCKIHRPPCRIFVSFNFQEQAYELQDISYHLRSITVKESYLTLLPGDLLEMVDNYITKNRTLFSPTSGAEHYLISIEVWGQKRNFVN